MRPITVFSLERHWQNLWHFIRASKHLTFSVWTFAVILKAVKACKHTMKACFKACEQTLTAKQKSTWESSSLCVAVCGWSKNCCGGLLTQYSFVSFCCLKMPSDSLFGRSKQSQSPENTAEKEGHTFSFHMGPWGELFVWLQRRERCLTESFQRKLREGGAFWYFIYLQPFQTLYRGHFICSVFSKKSCGYLRQMTLCLDTLIHSFIQIAICCHGAIVSGGLCGFFVSFEHPVRLRKTQLWNLLDKPY